MGDRSKLNQDQLRVTRQLTPHLQKEARCEETDASLMGLGESKRFESCTTSPLSSSAMRTVRGFFCRNFITASGAMRSPEKDDTKQNAYKNTLHHQDTLNMVYNGHREMNLVVAGR